MPHNSVSLPQLAAVLRAEYGASPSYRALYELAASAYIPARKGENGRWIIEDIPAAARKLGLTPLPREDRLAA